MRTWLLAIIRNVAINYLRAAFVRKVTLTDRTARHGVSPSAEREALERELTDEIWTAVLDMPLKWREVLILHAKYELNMKEIAGVLGISEGTVKSRLARARRRMADRWKEDMAYVMKETRIGTDD